MYDTADLAQDAYVRDSICSSFGEGSAECHNAMVSQQMGFALWHQSQTLDMVGFVFGFLFLFAWLFRKRVDRIKPRSSAPPPVSLETPSPATTDQ